MIEEESTAGKLDFESLRSAIEDKDPDALLSFYAEDAELRIVNAALPDGLAFELKGREQIERYLRAVCDQQMSCTVQGEILSGQGAEMIEFEEACEYPDGTSVVLRTKLELKEGTITHQLDVAQRRTEGDDQGVSPGGS